MAITITGNTGISMPDEGIEAKDLGNGGIIQVVNAVKTDAFTFQGDGAGSYSAVTGLAVTITPTTTTNKIIIDVVLNFTADSATQHCGFQIRRGSSLLSGYAPTMSYGDRTPSMVHTRNEGVNNMQVVPIQGHDVPGTTNATTYNVYASIEGTSNFYLNLRSGTNDAYTNYAGVSTIRAMEIVA